MPEIFSFYPNIPPVIFSFLPSLGNRSFLAAAVMITGLSVSAQGAANRTPVRESDHWSFQPLSQVAPPVMKDKAWVRTDVDRFILAAQEVRGVTPNNEAERAVLIRRLTFDLTGLPPTPEELASFLGDSAPDAYERLVDRLLSSPHYGEQWGRHWLDVARYADSNGYRYDDDQPEAYHYRDFVIRAFNDDMPYDQFVRWQLAGNELAPHDVDGLTANGFCAIGPKERDEGPPDVRKVVRYDEIDDLIATTGSSMLGLTLGCARCHDHKTDPISTREYYQLARVFNSGERIVLDVDRPLSNDQESKKQAWEAEQAALQNQVIAWYETYGAVIGPILAPKRAKLDADLAHVHEIFFKNNPSATEADYELEVSQLNRNPIAQKYFLYNVQGQFSANRRAVQRLEDPRKGFEPLAVNEVREALSPEAVEVFKEIDRRMSDLERRGFARQNKVLVYADQSAEPATTHILKRGSVSMIGEEVKLGFLDVLTTNGFTPDTSKPVNAKLGSNTTYQRAALGRWLTDAESGAGGLLARVMVNRMWHHHFGEGLVRTASDFGITGDTPDLPELLDWLARDFIKSGWSVKAMHRRILLSAVYRQSSESDEKRAALDPENRTLWRRKAVRISSENLRDAILSVSGTLNPERFGTSVILPIPEEAIITRAGTPYPKDIKDDERIRRRSVYSYIKRTIPIPIIQLFDGTDNSASCGGRLTTTVPTQALMLLNNEAVLARSADLADRVLREAPGGFEEQVARAFVLAIAREPTSDELAGLARFYTDQSLG
ncbi:MAG: DUF1549 and DUF1553 domain-containing protein [Verrucomicrobia bacterium]|nr:DUF1549 and DUF1553 domain-containing protein [Verrucomicrobiota bacterium]